MHNVLETVGEKAPAAWLRHSALPEENIRSFLRCGALFAWGDDRWIIAWGEPEERAAKCPARPSFYAPDFLLEDPAPWRVYPHAAAVSPDGLAQLLRAEVTTRVWKEFDAGAFAAVFETVREALQAGELTKAVPVVFDRSDGPLRKNELARALRALANLPAGLMPYGRWDADGGTIGASPELLFGNDGLEIRTMAVAGTARAGAVPDEIMDDPKERAEHSVVLEDLADQLAAFGPVQRGATRLWRVGMLSHLRTDLRVAPGRMPDFVDLVRLLHPTPAVGIAPREAWRHWIPRIDSEPRGSFAAPFGLALPDETARCLVAIRNTQWNSEVTRCGAGCGIVRGSNLQRELSELRLKLAATRGNLGL